MVSTSQDDTTENESNNNECTIERPVLHRQISIKRRNSDSCDQVCF